MTSQATVRCTCCYRAEEWSGDTPLVTVEGGSRRPAVHPKMATFEAYTDHLQGRRGPLVGTCTSCGQLLEGPEGMTCITHEIPTEAGLLLLSPTEFRGPSGALTEHEARRFLAAQYGEPFTIEAGKTAFSLFLFSFMAIPVLLWVASVTVVVVFLSQYSGELPVYVPD